MRFSCPPDSKRISFLTVFLFAENCTQYYACGVKRHLHQLTFDLLHMQLKQIIRIESCLSEFRSQRSCHPELDGDPWHPFLSGQSILYIFTSILPNFLTVDFDGKQLNLSRRDARYGYFEFTKVLSKKPKMSIV